MPDTFIDSDRFFLMAILIWKAPGDQYMHERRQLTYARVRDVSVVHVSLTKCLIVNVTDCRVIIDGVRPSHGLLHNNRYTYYYVLLL